jgi:RNA polymerase sigma-70 factor (ECF subfamily)
MNGHGPTEAERQTVFKGWLQEHAGLVFKVARAFAPSEADQQDLLQEILLQMWCSLPRFEGKAKASTWIYRVALNTALAWRRKEMKHVATRNPLIEIETLPGTEEDSPRRLAREEVITRLYKAIHQLPKVDAALVLLYLEDLSYREMAEVLGLSESNVGVKLNRARKALAELMSEVAYEFR